MIENISNNAVVRNYGPGATVCRARFTGQAATTIVPLDAFGVKSITQSTTTSGLFTVTLAEKFADFSAKVWVNGEAVRLHDCVVTAENFAAGTFTFQHYYSATDRTTTASVLTAGVLANGSSPLCYFQIEVVGRTASAM